jgi:hypothetical protein
MPPSQNKSFPLDPPIPAIPTRPSRKKRRLVWPAVLLVWLALAGLALANRQSIYDWWRLRGYQPPAAIQQLAAQDTMTPYTRHLFYLNKPRLVSSVASFRQYCPENKDTIVLGCYHPGQNGIYIYQVKDPALSGVVQVTAAHEVLHATYARLSSKDRQRVDGLLNNYYRTGLTNQRVKDEIKLYQKTEPHSVTDEMNSTFGTEIADLPTALETYYRQYFSNRAAIVAYEQQYDAVFTGRQAVIASDDQQLAAMKQQIDSREAALQAKQSQLSTTQSHLNSLLASGQTETYNAQIPAYNIQIDDYNNGVTSLKALISQYNQLVATRNAVASELATLDKALDTRLAPQTTH